MQKNEKSILNILNKQEGGKPPIWLMRQAGRYLPEYRDLRKKTDSFIEFCLTPSLACEATLQPLRRYDLDAAIIFADILLLPFALHQKVSFETGGGPRLDPLTSLSSLKWESEKLDPVFEAIERVNEELDPQTSLFGFCGGLWTVACYMIEGRGGTGFPTTVNQAKERTALLSDLLDILGQTTLEYIGRQIESGADLIQIFDSHAGLLQGEDFDAFVIKPTQALVSAIKAEYPGVPVIGFPRGAAEEDYLAYAQKTGVDGIGLDQSLSGKFIVEKLKPLLPLQGNLDPCSLLEGGDKMKREAERIVRDFGPRHIFNLGHGVSKDTPPEHVADLVSFVKGLS